jgi:riboflavin kinase/FMN adenylyltransferase
VHPAAVYVGRRPTFYEPGSAPVLVEAYLLDFEGDLYGEHVKVDFVHRLRGDAQYDSVDALIEQMHRDVDEVRRLLAP